MTQAGANATKFADLQVLEPDGLTREGYLRVTRNQQPPEPLRGTREHYTAPEPQVGWRERAACRDTAPAMFPHNDDPKGMAAARAVCESCPVQGECLDWALAHPGLARAGVYGGKSERQRASMLRVRRRAAAA